MELRERWQRLCSEIGTNTEAADAEWSQISKGYSDSSRHYHNLIHLQSMFNTLSGMPLENRAAIDLAVFYHDLVYDSKAKDNEEQSALLAEAFLKAVDSRLAARVSELIRATQKHSMREDDDDMAFFLDADLAILGSPPAGYQDYATQIRKEYSWVDEDKYREGRAVVLETFLGRERIYFTEQLRKLLEPAARENMLHELETLRRIG